MIYLDNAATTKLLPEVVEVMSEVLANDYGNPSSLYQLGRQAKHRMNQARQIVAQSIGARPHEIIWTSGGTEANNMALYSLAYTQTKRHIISSVIEHPSVLKVLQDLEQKGFQVTYLPVNEKGLISLSDLERALREDTSFVTIMSVNNEVGSIQPIKEIAELLVQHNIYFHTDAVQAYGNMPLNMAALPITMMSVSAHKIHGPKGIGCLYVRDKIPFIPLFLGGGQESNRRSGTENLHNIVGFAKAVQLLHATERSVHFQRLHQYFLTLLEQSGIAYALNGSACMHEKSFKIANIWFKNILSSKLLIQLDLKHIMVSAGSACSAGSLQASPVLKQMYPNTPKRAEESIRISFSYDNTLTEIETLIEILKEFAV